MRYSVFKVIDGQRSRLECELIEAICLGNMGTHKILTDRLNHRANLSLLKTRFPDGQDLPYQEESPD
jgi:hypothetical protein